RGSHAASVFVVIGANSHRDIREAKRAICVQAFVAQQYVVFVTIPGNVATKIIPKELARFVISNVRDRAQYIRQSKIVLFLAADPTIDGIDVLASIVIEIEHGRTPVLTER